MGSGSMGGNAVVSVVPAGGGAGAGGVWASTGAAVSRADAPARRMAAVEQRRLSTVRIPSQELYRSNTTLLHGLAARLWQTGVCRALEGALRAARHRTSLQGARPSSLTKPKWTP